MTGNTSPSSSEYGEMSSNTWMAWRDSGTSCGRRIFMRTAGTCQIAFSRSNSFCFAPRTSPGRAQVRIWNFSAATTVGQPV